jgi:hypothetical protein
VVKLDADMVLLDTVFLRRLADFFYRNTEVNRISLPVEDFYTNDQIMAVHCFRTRSVPETVKIEKPNPDRWIDQIRGVHIESIPLRLVSHGYNPSVEQAIRFGIHRILKAIAGGYSHAHWITLYKLYQSWKIRPHDAALCSAYFAVLEVLESNEQHGWSIVDSGGADNSEFLRAVSDRYASWVSAGSHEEDIQDMSEIHRNRYPAFSQRFYFYSKFAALHLRRLRGRYRWYRYFGLT